MQEMDCLRRDMHIEKEEALSVNMPETNDQLEHN